MNYYFYLLFALLMVISCDTKEKNLSEPIDAYFYVGGFLGPSYYVNIKENRLLYRVGFSHNQDKIQWKERALEQNEIADLIAKIKELKIPKWDKEYMGNAQDGTQWQVIFKSKELDISVHGSNKFPKEYKKFTTYISKILLKGQDFE